jgi:S-adenosylmethionine:tRNA ribosyltransferase-isomerase
VTATLDGRRDGPATLPGGFDFELPDELIATAPAEARGLARDEVRMLVTSRSDPGLLRDATARDLPSALRPGDLVVVNTSATMAAAVPVTSGPGDRLLHLSNPLPGGLWLVEPRRSAGNGSLPLPGGRPGSVLELRGGASARLLAPWPPSAPPALGAERLWVADLRLPGGPAGEPGRLAAYLARHGRPVRYGSGAGGWPLSAYQTVFADEPGSAEMPSAARPFTPALVTALAVAGVAVAPIVLHTGVSSAESHEAPYPEPYRVPAPTATLVNATHAAGGRVVGVGTTVTRALESVAEPGGRVHPGSGWTELVVTPERGVAVVDGLVTGWHEPLASHLALLEAVAGRPLLERSYAHALAAGYLWHEFGDLHLVLP